MTVDEVLVRAPARSAKELALKRVIQGLFVIYVAPRWWRYRLMSKLMGEDRAFLLASESISMIPGQRGIFARQAFYRQSLEHCGRDVSFGWLSTFSMPASRVGDNVYIGRRCSIGFADIGHHVMLADGVQILSGGREHGLSSDGSGTHQDQAQRFRRLQLGAGAWIGTGAVIMDDVGEHSVIGAGAVVNKPIPPRSLAVGVPAKVVKRLDGRRDAPASGLETIP